MTQREFDVLCIGFCIGAILFLWIGYRLRRRVERVEKGWWGTTRRVGTKLPVPAVAGQDYPVPLPKRAPPRAQPNPKRRPLPHRLPIADAVRGAAAERAAGAKAARDHNVPIPIPADIAQVVLDVGDGSYHHKDYEDVVAALTGAGYARASATLAVAACTAGERAAGIEQWTIAALRRAASAK